MPCQETTNCDKFPNENCYQTEKECQCNCPGGTLDPDSDECKCIAEEAECVGGRVRKTDCVCFCGGEKYLDDGVCYRYEYSCDGQTCFEVRGQGQYKNWADCNLNCGGGGLPPICFPVPTPPVGQALLCPNGRQYGIITYIYDPIRCRYLPFEIVWGNCNNLPPLPPPGPGDSSSAPGGSSSSAEECDCESAFSSLSNTSTEVCGETVPTMIITPVCNGGFRLFEWCEECGCDNKPTLKRQQLYVFRETSPYTGEPLCAFEYIPLPPQIGGPFPCPAACPGSSSSTSLSSGDSGSSSSTCGVSGATAINFSGNTQTGAPLNDFRENDYAEVTIYSPTGITQAREAETKWTFYVVYPNPNTNPAETPTRYDITDGDFLADEWPTFILTSQRLLDAIGLNFDTAPNGAYPFQLCAEAVNCAGIYDTQCAQNGITVNVTENTDPSSSSANSSSSGIAAPSSSSSEEPGPPCFPGSPDSGRVLYFVGSRCGGSGSWAQLNNWREVAAAATSPPADICKECVPTSLPDSSDTVILLRSVTSGPELAPFVNRLAALSVTDVHGLFIPVLTNSSAEFSGLFYLGRDITSTPAAVGEIQCANNTVLFRGASFNSGRVKGTAIFSDNAVNQADGEITCGATFNGASMRLDTGKISGTVICNTTSTLCSTAANDQPPAFCPNLQSEITAALSAAPINSSAVTFSAAAYTNELPSFCQADAPPGWHWLGRRLVKFTEEAPDIAECQIKIWELKNEIGLFHDGQYRLSKQCSDGSWYAFPLHFGYKLGGPTGPAENSVKFEHILPESVFD